MNVSEHFTLEELTRTSTGIENDPDPVAGARLAKLAHLLLEPIRSMIGAPLLVNSGYRCEAVNRAVCGDRNSAHLKGRACDFRPGNALDIKQVFDQIRLSSLPYDKILLEHHVDSWWIHVQIAKDGAHPRKQAYTAAVGPNGAIYVPVR